MSRSSFAASRVKATTLSAANPAYCMGGEAREFAGMDPCAQRHQCAKFTRYQEDAGKEDGPAGRSGVMRRPFIDGRACHYFTPIDSDIPRDQLR